ncbi:hypothetical protein F7R21_33005 [Burkholderia latens]|uniref:Uncharacterized protein n=1 Tax=Burkholderia latens TaxID=488446 RepID=A0A6H9SHQ9_9BURK|nr:hypothetical protein F7R21_33005 [Burkholderia latens]
MATPACCHAARAAAIEKIAHCVVSDACLYRETGIGTVGPAGQPQAAPCRGAVSARAYGRFRRPTRAHASTSRLRDGRRTARSPAQWLRAYPWISARIIPSTVASRRSASCSHSSTSAA